MLKNYDPLKQLKKKIILLFYLHMIIFYLDCGTGGAYKYENSWFDLYFIQHLTSYLLN